MHDTLATTITSRRVNSAAVAAWRRRSISSLTALSLSMKRSLARDVGLGLVVVVVADEVLDGVVGEELAQLAAELGGERLVVGDQQRRALELLDHGGHREGLAGAGGAEQRLEAVAGEQALDQRVTRLRLVGRRLVLAGEYEFVVGRNGHRCRLRNHHAARSGPTSTGLPKPMSPHATSMRRAAWTWHAAGNGLNKGSGCFVRAQPRRASRMTCPGEI